MGPNVLLLTQDPREPQCRQRLIDILGQEDATVLVQWLWERHPNGSNPAFGDVLNAVVEESEDKGPQFAKNLLDMARKPREVREMEMELIGWATPRIRAAAAAAKVMGYRGDPEVAKKEYADLAVGLMEHLQRVCPDIHAAPLRGAVLTALTHKNGQFSLDVAALVRGILTPMPVGWTMGTLAGLDDIVNRTTGGASGTPQAVFFQKSAQISGAAAAATVASRMTSLWTYDGQPSGGAVPAGVANPTNALAGSLQQASPGGGRTQYLLGITAVASALGTLILYDRLLHIGGFSGTTITAQNVGSTLTRNTGGVGNQIWVEIYTAVGSTGTTITASYTNQVPTAGQTTLAATFGGTGFDEAQRIIVLPLASGDTGVTAVASVTVLASTLTAGAFGVDIVQPLVQVPIGVAGVGGMRDLIMNAPGIVTISSGAALAWAWFANSTTAPAVMGSLHLIEA
jgi:hypothetical protein